MLNNLFFQMMTAGPWAMTQEALDALIAALSGAVNEIQVL